LQNYALLARYKSNRLKIMTHVTSAKIIDVYRKSILIAESVVKRLKGLHMGSFISILP